jgi:hypothetical protein
MHMCTIEFQLLNVAQTYKYQRVQSSARIFGSFKMHLKQTIRQEKTRENARLHLFMPVYTSFLFDVFILMFRIYSKAGF